MSANLVVDLGGTCQLEQSLVPPVGVNSYLAPASGLVVGGIIDLIHANTFTNVVVQAGQSHSGTFRVAVQTSDTTLSGDFVAPYSGAQFFPTTFTSGMVLTFGDASYNSGFLASRGFQAEKRYMRINLLAEATAQWAGALMAGVIRQKKTTGSGGGFTHSPAQVDTGRVGIGGTINV